MQNRMTHITDKWMHQDITKSNYKKMENPIKNRHAPLGTFMCLFFLFQLINAQKIFLFVDFSTVFL